MITLYIILGIIVFILVVLLIVAAIIHNISFGNRYEANPLIPLYTKEEFNLNSDPLEFKLGKYLIKGFMYHYDNYDNNKIIIFCHGMWSNHNSYLQDIEYLCRNNFQVFAFDYEGTSLSEGKNIRGLGNSLRSLDYAIKFIKEKYPNKEIYVMGHSWGGFATTNIIKYHKDIKGIIAMAPFCNVYKCLLSFMPKGLKILSPFIFLIEYFKVGKYVFSSSIKSLKDYKGKVLIVYSTNDKFVDSNKNSIVIKNNYPNFDYIITTNKNHNPNYTDEAVRKLNEFQNTISKLPNEKKEEYIKSINFHELGELDSSIMDRIVEFINK